MQKYLEPLIPKLRCSTPQDVVVPIDEVAPKSSIPVNYHLLNISKDKGYMAVLQTDWTLVVYKLKIRNGEIDYQEKAYTYNVGEIDSIKPAYIFLSVCSGTGDVALSFAEMSSAGLFVIQKPKPEYRHCRFFLKGENNDDTIEFQGRAVYANNKLVLIGEHSLQVHHTGTLKMEYFLDLSVLRTGYEAFIGGKDIARQVTWGKIFGVNHITVDEGIKLISMTRYIHNNILVTTYKGDITRV